MAIINGIHNYNKNVLLNTEYERKHSEEANDLPDYEEDSLSNFKPATIGDKLNVMQSTSCSNFKDFFLKPFIIKSLNVGGFEYATEIQNECIPQVLLGSDILVQAQSGTGKTLTYILSTLQLLEVKDNQVQTLVICPTRELASQIGKQYEYVSTFLSGVRVGIFSGSLPFQKDVDILKSSCPHIVVGTLGRILLLLRSKILDVQYLKHFVLDECDQILQASRIKLQIREVDHYLPRDKQVLMFTATLNHEIRRACKELMRNPIEIYIDRKEEFKIRGLVQHYVWVSERDKLQKLVEILGSLRYKQAVVFVNSARRCRIVENLLVKQNYSVIGIHGNMSQKERLFRLQEIRNCKKRILVATKVFGRELSVVGSINTVINYNMSDSLNSYLHRVARMGRFTRTAITLITNEEDFQILNKVQTRFHVKITKLSL